MSSLDHKYTRNKLTNITASASPNVEEVEYRSLDCPFPTTLNFRKLLLLSTWGGFLKHTLRWRNNVEKAGESKKRKEKDEIMEAVAGTTTTPTRPYQPHPVFGQEEETHPPLTPPTQPNPFHPHPSSKPSTQPNPFHPHPSSKPSTQPNPFHPHPSSKPSTQPNPFHPHPSSKPSTQPNPFHPHPSPPPNPTHSTLIHHPNPPPNPTPSSTRTLQPTQPLLPLKPSTQPNPIHHHQPHRCLHTYSTIHTQCIYTHIGRRDRKREHVRQLP
ncbi:hypothetical protein Pcinc_008284 [Petrolisthes cinctipes]|uniref:Uncharacterized protein n=1 Tax=Petrolisthes cinctipes TaxID=88211 RepID=A0AAE1G6R1_PETCI|nr:hypothetical protein Pcinc_008284 [Petrolisthes cinctipes]